MGESLLWEDYPEQLEALESAVAEGLDWETVANRVNRQMGPERSAHACRHKSTDLGLEVASGVSMVDTDVALERWKRKAEFYRSQYAQVVSVLADQDNLIESMRDVLSVIEPRPMKLLPPTPGNQENEEAVFLVSDMQLGTKSLGDELNLTQPRVWGSLGEYNVDVLRYRIRIWLRAAKKILKLHRASIPVRKGNILFLGDILENRHLFSLNLS